jgi:hypothetical protein
MTLEVFEVYLDLVVEEFLQLWAGIPGYYYTKDVGFKAFTL